MKKVRLLAVFTMLAVTILSSAPLTSYAAAQGTIYLDIGGKQLSVQLADTAAAKELAAMLEDGQLTIKTTGNSFEQYGSIGRSLTTSDTSITAQAGDVLLYNANTLCFFYGSNSYSYTRIGTMQGASQAELKNLLSGSNATITLSKNAFGPVPYTGVADVAGRFQLLGLVAAAALCAWVAFAWQRRRESTGDLYGATRG